MTAAHWSDGSRYEAYMGRWSRAVAAQFVAWLARPAGQRWVELGCGTGALTEVVLSSADARSVVAVEPSRELLDAARRRIADQRVRFVEGDAQQLPHRDADVAVAGLVLNFVPDVGVALGAMAGALRAGGVVAAHVWDYADGMQLLETFWRVACRVDPEAARFDERTRFPLCRPGALAAGMRDAGLLDVEELALVVPTVFADFDALWTPFLGAVGPAPAYLSQAPDRVRDRIRDELAATVPRDERGRITLTARAWAARGRIG